MSARSDSIFGKGSNGFFGFFGTELEAKVGSSGELLQWKVL